MSTRRGVSRFSIYRLRMKRARETAARLQYFRQRLLDLQHQQTSWYPKVTAEQPTVPELEERSSDANDQRTICGKGTINTTDMVQVLQRWYEDSLPTMSQLQNLMQHLRPFLPDLPRDH
ncbi:unnamed protein product [Calicophoron daubneyi]|uniref:Uncharacterized protein n=1 Tax=Calicophoron daubneyi TaxID=300641 RepID=A0AAV2T643_CALDB